MEQTSSIQSIQSYFPLVDKIVRSEMRKLALDREMFEEIRSFGMEGLALASQNFDPARGVPFEFYAQKRIRWSIYDGFRTCGRFPRNLIQKIKFLRTAEEMTEAALKSPAPSDKSEATHRFRDILGDLAAAFVVGYTGNRPCREPSIPAEFDDRVDQKRIGNTLRLYVQSLPEKERIVIERHFYRDERLIDIAQDMKITISWVSKILSSGLRRLREMFEHLDEYRSGSDER